MTYYEGKEAVTRESDYTDLMHTSVSVCAPESTQKNVCTRSFPLLYSHDLPDEIRIYRYKRSRDYSLFLSILVIII